MLFLLPSFIILLLKYIFYGLGATMSMTNEQFETIILINHGLHPLLYVWSSFSPSDDPIIAQEFAQSCVALIFLLNFLSILS